MQHETWLLAGHIKPLVQVKETCHAQSAGTIRDEPASWYHFKIHVVRINQWPTRVHSRQVCWQNIKMKDLGLATAVVKGCKKSAPDKNEQNIALLCVIPTMTFQDVYLDIYCIYIYIFGQFI